MKQIELVEKRKPREKHFLQEDGTIIANLYDEDIHYLKDGKYEEIDNTLIDIGNYYVNKRNSYKLYFGKDILNSLMRIEKEKHYIDFRLNNSQEFLLNIEETNDKYCKKIKYIDLLKNIDFEYSIQPSKIKEDIILKSSLINLNKIEFTLNTDMKILLNNDKSVDILDDERHIFKIESPFMIDSAGKINKNVYYELIKEEFDYKLNLILDTKWLKSKEITYPVRIDPTITNYTNENSVYDTYIFPGDSNVDRNSQDILKVGVERVNNQDRINRALLKFDLPVIGTGSQILSASVNLVGYPITPASYNSWLLEVHEITDEWNEQNANWNNLNNKYKNRVETLFYGRRSSLDSGNNINAELITFNITSLVRKWYTDEPNNGIMIKMVNEVYENGIIPAFFSKNNNVQGTNPKPLLTIRYYNQNGLENYMSYQKEEFINGKSYINNYNGNMTSIFDLLQTYNSIFPVNLYMVYNTNDVILNKSIGYGLGFKLNYHQTIKETIIDEITYLEYVDEDGTIHYFNQLQDGKYYDEDGLNLIVERTNSFYLMKNKSNQSKKFDIQDGIGYLTEIINSSGDSLIITYSNDKKIIKIKDSNNDEINVTYNTNQIVVSSSNETKYINYNNNQITSINSQAGITQVTYNNNNLINRIMYEDGISTVYEYYSQIPYRIYKITGYGHNNAEGRNLEFVYGYDSTTIIDEKGKKNTIVFNSAGNVSSISITPNGGSQIESYGKREFFGGNNSSFNKLTSNGTYVKYIKNYLNNISFEQNNVIFIAESGVQLQISSEYANTGNNSLKVTNSLINKKIYKEIDVEKGNYYTFSAYIKNNNNLKIGFVYYDNNNQIVEKYSNTIYPNNEFARYDITTDFPIDATSNLKIVFLLETVGTLYIDDVQLEKSETMNDFNYIENSDFSNGMQTWDYSADDTITGGTVNHDNYFEPVEMDGMNALKIKMNSRISLSVGKNVGVQGQAGDLFNISFWYKCDGIDISDDMTYNNVVVRFDEVGGHGHGAFMSKNFNPNPTEWQYFSYTFIAVDDYTGLSFDFLQLQNANNLFITGINLVKDFRESNYTYDENGNIVKISNLNNKDIFCEYDNKNQLIKMIDPVGNKLKIEYDNIVNNRILNAFSPAGIINQIIYDAKSNPTTTKQKYCGNLLVENNKLCKIRQKGTNNYLNNITLAFENESFGNKIWKFEQIGEYYRIKNELLSNKYLIYVDTTITLGNYNANNSLFELIENENGSYSFKCKDANLYLKTIDGNLSISNTFEENNHDYQFYIESSINDYFIENAATYTNDGKFMTSLIDSLLNKTIYNVNLLTGDVLKVIDAKGNYINYSYNDRKQITNLIQKEKNITYEYDTYGQLSKIQVGNKDYIIIYDDFLNISQIKLGNNITLITYNYEINNGNLLSITYGNNNIISYEYDDFNRINKLLKGTKEYKFIYNNNGYLSKVTSNANEEYNYTYDISQNVQSIKQKKLEIYYTYDSNDNITNRKYKYDNLENNLTTEFTNDGIISKIISDGSQVEYISDDLGRLVQKKINSNYITDYDYYNNGKRTSLLIKNIINNNDKYMYKYDKFGNVTHIYHNNNLEVKYYYNEYDELIREDNYLINKTIRYKYDLYGNILYKRFYEMNTYNLLEKNTYEYDNVTWKDKLSKFNDEIIVYDNIGNPTQIGNKTLIWTNGRELSSYNTGSQTISYEYNKDGIRTKKVVNGIETKYYIDKDEIIVEKTGSNVIYYIRNSLKDLIGFKYNNNNYFYVKNLHDDIIGILNSNNQLIVKYEYDSFGNILNIIDNSNINLSQVNKYRYRSYYYDGETGYYYLKARYYVPSWGRFLSADNYISTDTGPNGYNMYAYCNNNFIKYKDYDGHFITVGLVVTLAAVGGALLGYNYYQGKKKAKEISKVQQKKQKKEIPDRTAELNAKCEQSAKELQEAVKGKNPAETLVIFKNSVTNNAKYDLKETPEWNEELIYNGTVFDPQDTGNFHYGYIGRSIGIPVEVLVLGAGANQFSNYGMDTFKYCFTFAACDDPRDTYYIRMGALKYDEEN